MTMTVRFVLARRLAGRLISRGGITGTSRLSRMFAAGLALGMTAALYATNPVRADDDSVKACFEGPARTMADRFKGDDPLSRHLAEMRAGRECADVATRVIDQCLAEVDASDADVKDYYPCIGKVANPCIDSDFATTDFRKVVCIGTEEQVWIDHLHADLAALKAMVPEETRKRFAETEKSFFNYRNRKCKLMRTVYDGDSETVAYGACTTETAARFVIDLRDMKAKVSATLVAAGKVPATREGAEQLLARFLEPAADRAALTKALKPADEDYATVYKQPFADKLRESQAPMWADDPVIRPDKNQTEIKLIYTTTDRLRDDNKMRRAFPGGYAKVVAQMKPGIPIVYFKFVEPGSSAGRAFDGLVYVNGHWVIMPRPWRAGE